MPNFLAQVSKDGLTHVHVVDNELHLFYHNGAYVVVTFTSYRIARRVYADNNWLYPSLDESSAC